MLGCWPEAPSTSSSSLDSSFCSRTNLFPADEFCRKSNGSQFSECVSTSRSCCSCEFPAKTASFLDFSAQQRRHPNNNQMKSNLMSLSLAAASPLGPVAGVLASASASWRMSTCTFFSYSCCCVVRRRSSSIALRCRLASSSLSAVSCSSIFICGRDTEILTPATDHATVSEWMRTRVMRVIGRAVCP